VADTYNNKVKVLDPATGLIETLAGIGGSGDTDSSAGFDEPAGLTAAKGKLFVADTNNHRIRVIDLGSSVTLSTLDISGLEPPGS
jgi:DNA-binding beta-propeller fold protein YncE